MSVLAAHGNGGIYLGSGTAAPTKTLEIPLGALTPKVPYNITCTITDPNNLQNKIILVARTKYTIPFGVGDFYLNGKDVGRGDGFAQFQLPQIKNTFEATKQFHLCKSLNFINSDQDDSVSVSCYAVPM